MAEKKAAKKKADKAEKSAPAAQEQAAPAQAAPAAAAAPAQAAPARPEMRAQAPAQPAAPTGPEARQVPMNVSAARKKVMRTTTVLPYEALYIDRAVDKGGYGSYAADGREVLGFDAALSKSLLRHTTAQGGRVWQMIMPVKVTICGDDKSPQLFVLNGRQRAEQIRLLTIMFALIWKKLVALGGDKVKLKNVLLAEIAGINNGGDLPADWAEAGVDPSWMDEEDIEVVVGGRVNGEAVPGFFTESGPIPYHIRVEYTDIDPNDPGALEMSLAERINVPTPPLVEAQQLQRLLDAGRSPESVASHRGVDVKTVYNRLLVLHVIPEVQEALDPVSFGSKEAPLISWTTLRQMFFRDVRRHGVVPHSPDEQRATLARLRDGGSGRATKPAEPAAPTAGGDATAAAPGAQPTGTPAQPGASAPATQPGSPAPAPQPAPQPAAQTTRVASVLTYLPRAADTLRLRYANALPEPDPADGAERYWELREARVMARTAADVMAYLGGDSTALDGCPALREAIASHLSEAVADADMVVPDQPQGPALPVAAPKKGRKAAAPAQSDEERYATRLIDMFSEWEIDERPERPEWPAATDEAVRGYLARIQAAYAEALSRGEEVEKAGFATEWVLQNLLKTS